MRRVLKTFGVFFLCSAGVPIAVTVTILAAFLFLPLPASLPDAKPTVASQISHVLDALGNEIGVFREFEQNVPIRPEDIPEHLKQAVIASEDRNFYAHGGVDVGGSFRALWADLRNQSLVQGGSTITQQYVKNAYTGADRTIVRKIREAILASQLDRQFEKDEILFRYLDSIYLGDGIYGVGAAAESYFRKPISELTLSESATIAGLIPAPSRYAPRSNPSLAESKRRIVLNSMLDVGFITQAEYEEALAQGVWLASTGPAPGPAVVVHPPVQQFTQFPFFVDYVRRYLVAKYGPAKVFRGGLQIQTTLDPEMQAEAEKAVAEGLRGTTHPIEMALVAVEPPTGFVKALVGGRDFTRSQVNLALGACPTRPLAEVPVEVEASCWSADNETVEGGGTGRQPGSSWKPFVLAAAFAKGLTPSKTYPAPNAYRVPGCTGATGCTIRNYEGASFGSANLRTATWKSINTVYAQLIDDVGVKETAEMAKKLGITSAWSSPRVHGLSYALGAQEVSPLDMAASFGVFATGGKRHPPTPIVKIIDAEGNVLEDNTNRLEEEGEQVLDPVIATNVTDVLRGVITSGTGTRANIGRPAAGKTGTAQEWRDAWFVGFTPSLSTSVWMGNELKPTPLRGIKGVRNVAGGTIPAGVWRAFMVGALRGVAPKDFDEPAPIRPVADALKREARGGISPGRRRAPMPEDMGGPYSDSPPSPDAQPPPRRTTTSTTRPEDDGDDDPGRTTTTLVPFDP
ncbi:MAG: transglycosylase domain-containing protein [Actinobacteria bacterium]|nr:transglycosylase domain-containing protein [Actinomycetota bacterium]